MFLENGKLIFDRENCENCVQEAIAWDEEDHYEKVLEIYGSKYNHIESMDVRYSKSHKGWVSHPNQRLCKDPMKERLYKRRKHSGTYYNFKKESYSETKIAKKSFRRKMKRTIHNEEFYSLRPRDYHTYGWNTW